MAQSDRGNDVGALTSAQSLTGPAHQTQDSTAEDISEQPAPAAPAALSSPIVRMGLGSSMPSPVVPADILARCIPYPAYVLVPPDGFTNATDHVKVQPTVVYVPAVEHGSALPSAEELEPFYPGGPITGLQAPNIDLNSMLANPLNLKFPNLLVRSKRDDALSSQLDSNSYGELKRYCKYYSLKRPIQVYQATSARNGQLRAAQPHRFGLTHRSPVITVATPRSWIYWLIGDDQRTSATINTMSNYVALCELDSLMPSAVNQLASSGQLQKFMVYLTHAPSGPNDLVGCNWAEDGQRYMRPWIPINVTPATAVTLMVLDKGGRRAAGKMIAACPVPIIPEIKKLGDRGFIDGQVLGYILKWGLAFAAKDLTGMALRLNGLAEAVAQYLWDKQHDIGTQVVDDVTTRLATLERTSASSSSNPIFDINKPLNRGLFHAVVLAGAFKFAARINAADERRNLVIRLAISCIGEVVADAVPFGHAIIGPIRFAVGLISDNFINSVLPPRDWAEAFHLLLQMVRLKVTLDPDNFLGGMMYTNALVTAFTTMTAQKSAYDTIATSISLA